jgi:dihydrofolate synthase/folylpolyglutamate synthase
VNFEESETYLLSLGNEVSAMKLGLANIRTLLDALGNPQNGYLKVQVAGTNGKGSVCAFLDAICIRAGIRTGLTISPHLISITERIRINGEDITEDGFARLATHVRKTSEGLVAAGELETVPTYFEHVTAIALLAFAEARVELAILETGLGGRLDATTAAEAEIVALTRIDYDHQNILGNTLEKIAAEKAAIICRRSSVVIGEQQPAAMKVIRNRCSELGIEPKLAERVRTICDGEWAAFFTDRSEYNISRLGLIGRHQSENARIAIVLAEALQEQFLITEENVVTGLESARHPGRLEFRGRFLFDGAHNIGGARALREYLDEFVDKSITLVFGTMRDKDVNEIGQILFPKAHWLILTEPRNSRALETRTIAKAIPNGVINDRVVITRTVSEALDKAVEISTSDNVILVTGSIYLVGEAQKILKENGQV